MANTPTNSNINLGLPANVPEEFTDPQPREAVDMLLTGFANLLRQLEQYLGITQKDISLWSSLRPSDTIVRNQAGRLYVTAGENLILSHLINLYNDAGTLKARKANATSGTVRPAHGFCSTIAGILTGEIGEVILSQGLAVISGVSVGDKLYLSTSAGQPTIVAPTAAGQLEQFVGIGVESNVAYLDISLGQYIQH